MINNFRVTCFLAVLAVVFAGIIGCAGNGGGGGMTLGGGSRGLDQYVQAVRAYENGDSERTIDLLKGATKSDPKLTMAHSMLGDMYRGQGNYSEALAEYQTAADLDPYTAESHYKLGVAYQLLNKPNDAVKAYQRAIELDENNVSANMNLGLVYVGLGQLEDAVTFTRKATEIDPKSAIALSNYGVALDAHGEYAEAERAYRQSLAIDPKQEVTRVNLATNLITQNKSDEALTILREIVANADTPENRKRLGDALVRAGQMDQAATEYEKALKLDPKFYPAMNSIGSMRIAEYKKGLELDDDKRNLAVQMWARSLSVNPEQPKIRAALNEWRKAK